MKKCFIYIVLLFCVNAFAQEKKQRSYKFDTYKLQNIKNYKNNIFHESHFFTNSNDSTYILELRYGNKNEAILFIRNENRELIKFDLDFKYSKIEDLNQLTNSILYNRIYTTTIKKKFKDNVIDMEFENDTIGNQIIVHLIQYKNKKKKKVINEHYYFFSKNNELLKNDSVSSLSDYLIKKYDLMLIEGLKIDRIMHLENSKLSKDTHFLESKKIDFTFTFKIDEVK